MRSASRLSWKSTIFSREVWMIKSDIQMRDMST